MQNTEKTLIHALLDKYERSAAYRTGKQSNRRILLKLYDGKGKTDFNFYDISDYDRRVDVNSAIELLFKKGIISFEWLRGETGHIISKVWLNYDQIDVAYQLAERSPKLVEVNLISEQAKQMLNEVKSNWAKEYFNDILTKANDKRDFGSSIPCDNSERVDLWKLILFFDSHNEVEFVERVLSMRLFSDSKRFETALRSKFLSVLRKYFDTDKLCDNDDELLRQIGIVKYPEYFEFCGALSLSNEHGVTNFNPLSHGGSLSVVDLQGGNIIMAANIKKIITIENRANYIQYISKTKSTDELVIYHAGHYSPAKKKFFVAVNASMPKDCNWYHWGDIDLGGFTMLARLRREINPNIFPFQMSKNELIQYERYCAKITGSYEDKLRGIIGKPELIDCTSCLKYMLDKKIRLEQESMLLM